MICGTAGFSWEHTSDVQDSNGGSAGFPTGTSWGVFIFDCGFPVAGVTVQLQNVHGWALQTNGTYLTVTDDVQWCGVLDPATTKFADDNSCPGGGMTGPIWMLPVSRTFGGVNGPVSVHWASAHRSVGSPVCALTTYQAKYSGPPARVLANAGFDFWSGSTPRAAGVGRFHLLSNTSWTWLNFTDCTAAQLAMFPPPL